MLYPFSTNIILTDTIFTTYGGHTGTSVAAQRNAAYFIAEKAATSDVGTLLLPTIVTGTFFPNLSHLYVTDYGYVNTIHAVRFIDEENTVLWEQLGLSNGYVGIRGDKERGIVDINYWAGECGCCNGMPYNVQIVYTAGLPSGTSFRSDVLLALTTYADIVINEITGYGNEAPGDIGVQDFSNQQYRESRVQLLRTQFGTSARAQFASKLLTSLRKMRYVGI